MLEVLSHRGYWKNRDERNEEVAFERSFSMGFGTETDIRDLNGRLVISHDMPQGDVMGYDHFLALLDQHAPGPLPLAVNIKADGLAEDIARMMKGSRHNWYVFDASVPDMLMHLKAGNPTFARMSEYEQFPELLDGRIKGIWLDAFHGTWYGADTITGLLDRGLEVCVVSSELHGRGDHADLWQMLKTLRTRQGLSVCTDLPEEATALIHGA